MSEHKAHASWSPPRLTPARAQETIRRLHDIRRELADIRHYLEGHDQGAGDDPCDLAAKDIATCLPELKAAAGWLKEIAG